MKMTQECRELGKEFAAEALSFLVGRVGGKEVELGDLGVFQASAAAWIAGKGFCLALEKGGMEAAERFLAQLLSGVSAVVRLKGAPVMVTLEGRIDPVDLGAEAPAAPACACPGLKGSECPTCPPILREHYLSLIKYLQGYIGEMAARTAQIGQVCAACGAAHADQVLGGLVRETPKPPDHPELDAQWQQAVAIALQTVRLFGVSEVPETTKALQERGG
jgi:hypothetical protein